MVHINNLDTSSCIVLTFRIFLYVNNNNINNINNDNINSVCAFDKTVFYLRIYRSSEHLFKGEAASRASNHNFLSIWSILIGVNEIRSYNHNRNMIIKIENCFLVPFVHFTYDQSAALVIVC